ncbi:hypothetical protein [Clostridium vincentii]|uniref:Uncharacterized protein n=1 Tax=Clostridium vincentii TaxID=52704 RepID=A0A2T0BHK0_9CLOT|nr:hypothetical protein [Clostridium vincentii]PRR83370.1 hypothetical protein CLVI_09170 [Clostridium vincentii]
MKIKRILMIFLIFIIGFTQSPKAIISSKTYKQGIYNISEIQPFNATAKLITPNNVTSLVILDSNGNQKLYKRFDVRNEVINLGTINNGDIILVVGTGEIAIIIST